MRPVLCVLSLAMVLGCFSSRVFAQTSQPAVREAAVLYVPPPCGIGIEGIPATPGIQTSASTDDVWNRTISTHAALIENPTLVKLVIGNLNSPILKTEWYSRFNDREGATRWLQQNIHAKPVAGTALIQVSVSGDISDKDAALLVNDVVAHYLHDNRKRETDKLVEQVSLLTNLKMRYEAKLRSDSQKIAALVIAKGGVPTTQSAITHGDDEIEMLKEERDSLKAVADRLRDQLDSINSALSMIDMRQIIQVVYPGTEAAQ